MGASDACLCTDCRDCSGARESASQNVPFCMAVLLGSYCTTLGFYPVARGNYSDR